MVTFSNDPAEKVFTAVFTGRMDTLAVQKIGELVQANLPLKDGMCEGKIVFDLQAVDYISSSFIRTCVCVAKQSAPGQFSIINCQPFITKTFKISGLDDLLNVS